MQSQNQIQSILNTYLLPKTYEFTKATTILSEENRTTIRRFVELGDTHYSVESGRNRKGNVPVTNDKRMTSSEVDRRINEIVVSRSTELEALIRSVKELSESSIGWTEMILAQHNSIEIVSTFRQRSGVIITSEPY